jgi:hypothetical protein
VNHQLICMLSKEAINFYRSYSIEIYPLVNSQDIIGLAFAY